MLRQGLRVILGIAVTACVAMLATMKELPIHDSITRVGKYLAGDVSLCLKDGQGEKRLLAELLGGQEYICLNRDENESKDALILLENKDIYDIAKENREPMVGDVEDSQKQAVINIKQQQETIMRHNNVLVEQLKETGDVNYLWKNFYIVDSTTSVTKDIFHVKQMLQENMKMAKKNGKKQILIYHTHGASEGFCDSRSGKVEDTVVGVGDELTKELEKRGYGVYHDRTQYDRVGKRIDRSFAYNQSLEGITKIKKANPNIEVMIDLHRDSVGKGKHTYTTIQGRKTAIVMFFNGMSRTKSGPISYLSNPNLKQNLAFSLQLKCKAMEYYDGFTKPIYLKGYRYNLHLLQKSLLIELGNENNTMEEAKNAAMPLADVLDKVLSGKE